MDLLRTVVSEERVASIFREERISEMGTLVVIRSASCCLCCSYQSLSLIVLFVVYFLVIVKVNFTKGCWLHGIIVRLMMYTSAQFMVCVNICC
jgi:hypothetical protein